MGYSDMQYRAIQQGWRAINSHQREQIAAQRKQIAALKQQLLIEYSKNRERATKPHPSTNPNPLPPTGLGQYTEAVEKLAALHSRAVEENSEHYKTYRAVGSILNAMPPEAAAFATVIREILIKTLKKVASN